MKKERIARVVVVVLLATLVSCASSGGNLQRATARHVPGVTPPDVQVSAVKRRATTVEWTAQTPKGVYQCWADDMVRQPVCRPQ